MSSEEKKIQRSGKETIDGIGLYYEIHGTGPHICLFTPALVGSALRLRPVIGQMNQKEFTFVLWDPPGYGKSRPPDRNLLTGKYPLHHDAILAGKLMQTLGFEKYSAIGWSNGGLTSLLLAAEYPEKVERVVICNVAAQFDHRVKMFLEYISDLSRWEEDQRAALLEDYEEAYVKWMLQTWIKYNEKCWPSLAECVYDKVTQVKSSTLFIQSKHDTFVCQNPTEFFKQKITNYRVQIIPYGAHDYLEFLPDFIEATEKFLLEKN